MSYTPPEDIICRFWTVICSRHHAVWVCRPQNCDKNVISDFVRKKPIFSLLRSAGSRLRGGVKIWGGLFFSSLKI